MTPTVSNSAIYIITNYGGEVSYNLLETILIDHEHQYPAAVIRLHLVLERSTASSSTSTMGQPQLLIVVRPGHLSKWFDWTKTLEGVKVIDASLVADPFTELNLSQTNSYSIQKNEEDQVTNFGDLPPFFKNTSVTPDRNTPNLIPTQEYLKPEPYSTDNGVVVNRSQQVQLQASPKRKPKIHINPFVTYLTSYNTVGAAHSQAYTEYQQTQDQNLAIETSAEKFLLQMFTLEKIKEGGSVRSVILTGNAGDGKTRLCQLVWNKLSSTNFSQAGQSLKNSEIDLVNECGYKVKVIKDLSDWSVSLGTALLQELVRGKDEQGIPTIYLIAANEGRLRNTLQDPTLIKLREQVQDALDGKPREDGPVVLNLNQVSTSLFVPKLIEKMTVPQQWEACQECPALSYCPIKWNRDKFANTDDGSPSAPAQRLHELYKLIERLGKHITFRDALIHLTYAIVGKLNCQSVQAVPVEQSAQFLRWVYYRNIYGDEADRDFQQNGVTAYLRKFDVGANSNFHIDELILKGHLSENKNLRETVQQIYRSDLDLGGSKDLFFNGRNLYLEKQYLNLVPKALLTKKGYVLDLFKWWLPHCRRKYFFEWPETNPESLYHPYNLLPFKSYPTFRSLFSGDVNLLEKQDKTKTLVKAINRAFSEMFVDRKDILFVTSRTGFSTQVPVPIIRASYQTHELTLDLEQISFEVSKCLDREPAYLVLSVMFEQDRKIELPINLLLFEYLYRVEQGTTLNFLMEECGLAVAKFQKQLLDPTKLKTTGHHLVRVLSYINNKFVIQDLSMESGDKLQISQS